MRRSGGGGEDFPAIRSNVISRHHHHHPAALMWKDNTKAFPSLTIMVQPCLCGVTLALNHPSYQSRCHQGVWKNRNMLELKEKAEVRGQKIREKLHQWVRRRNSQLTGRKFNGTTKGNVCYVSGV